jgi:hypothetical protein
VRLCGGMTNDVFALLDDPDRVVKGFRTPGDAAHREWDALVALGGSGIAPEPVHLAAGDPAVVVMTRVRGSSRPADSLGADHARAIGEAHRLVHRTVPDTRRPPSHSGVRTLRAALMGDDLRTASEADTELEVVPQAWQAARTWIAAADIARLLSFDPPCFSRGDPNLTNYLWNDDGLVLVDWESSGHDDPALQLADMAEHASTRTLGGTFWDQVADATDLTQADRARVADGRRLMACFWLVLIASRQRDGLPTTVTLDEQAARTLLVLDT